MRTEHMKSSTIIMESFINDIVNEYLDFDKHKNACRDRKAEKAWENCYKAF